MKTATPATVRPNFLDSCFKRFVAGATLALIVVIASQGLANAATTRTRLMFPFVSNQNGFDTGIAISNGSSNPFGTTPQSGTCTISFYGINPVSPITTPVISAGQGYTATLSSVAPGFQGYLIAACSFGFGEGLADINQPLTHSMTVYIAKVWNNDTPLLNRDDDAQ